MKIVLTAMWSCMFLLSGMALAQASGFSVGDIQIDQPWARSLPAVSKNGAVYMLLRNSGGGVDSLVAASTAVSDRAELHTHLHQDGMMMMRPIEKVEIPPGGEVALEPGGHHLMLMGLNRPMDAGGEFLMKLRFEKAGEVEVTVSIGQP